MVIKKINKEIFIEKFKPTLDIKIVKMFQKLYPKIQDTFPQSILYQQEKLKIDKNFLVYKTYILESDWRNAPYEEFFREFNQSSCIIENTHFTLQIEDSFLKTKSQFSFQFICDRKLI